ncbi:mechanosensitive ion channel family protein [Marinobacterium jannaschii]|uniref:mechanosensitive ion channel family protein n=1 Tax=Marinobacterium jannaschii TaxID=64970 RepID=UPI000B2D2ADE|nr:mechanosensitive ion channel domain-containing protein [Marinobacterium jannaschii]
MENFSFFVEGIDVRGMLLQHKLLVTVAVIALVSGFKIKLSAFLRLRSKQAGQDRRHAINIIKNLINITLVIGLFLYWSDELQKFALSVAAFVVAFVIATREFIQCIIGFIYIFAARPFQVGDWIQVGDYSGEVTETDWAKLTLLEVDISSYSHTGKTLYLPNNMLLSSSIKNLNFLKRYATHTFAITRDQSVDLFSFMDELLVRATKHCEGFYDVANRYNSLIEKRLDVTIAGPAPSAMVSTTENGRNRMYITIFCPSDQALEIEQKITRDFMQLWYAAQEIRRLRREEVAVAVAG